MPHPDATSPAAAASSAPSAPAAPTAPSARRAELLEAAYRYVLAHGVGDMSLRPLAGAIGSSPRVLLYLFGSKDGLIRALLGRARADELAFLAQLARIDEPHRRGGGAPPASGETETVGLVEVAARVWAWLTAVEHRALLTLWVEGYARSLLDPSGPWADFARATVADWLEVLGRAQPAGERDTPAGRARRTLVLAVLRGALLDLLATDDAARTTEAVHQHLAAIKHGGLSGRGW